MSVFAPAWHHLRLLLRYRHGRKMAFIAGSFVAWGPEVPQLKSIGVEPWPLVLAAITAGLVVQHQGDPTRGLHLPLRACTRGAVTFVALLGPAVLGWLGGLLALFMVVDAVPMSELALAAIVFTVSLAVAALQPAIPGHRVRISFPFAWPRRPALVERSARSIGGPLSHARMFWRGCVDEARALAPWAAALLAVVAYASQSQSAVAMSIARITVGAAFALVVGRGASRGLGLPGESLAGLLCVPIPLTALARLLFAHTLMWSALLLLGLFSCLLWMIDASGRPTRGVYGALVMAFALLPFSSAFLVRQRFCRSPLSWMSRVRLGVLGVAAFTLLLAFEPSDRPNSMVLRQSWSFAGLATLAGAVAVIAMVNVWEVLSAPPLRSSRTSADRASYRSQVWSWGATR